MALGTNLGDRREHIRRALRSLASLTVDDEVACSPLYESAPMGPQDQPAYLNAVCRFATVIEPLALLDALQAIEHEHGRRRGGAGYQRWGPRPLDLDMLLYGTRTVASERLTIPHPGLAQRDFVLLPLADLAPSLQIPGLGPLGGLLNELPAAAVQGQSPIRRLPISAANGVL